MSIYGEIRKRALAGQQQEETPEKIFEDSVKEVINSYMRSKFEYVVQYPGYYNVEQVDMDSNSALLSYNIQNTKGDVIGSVPIMFNQGKVREPWAIFIPVEQRFINLSEEFLAKLAEVSENYSGAVGSWKDYAPARALYSHADNYNEFWMNPKRSRAMLENLPTDKLISLIRTAHKDAGVYFTFGRLATKVAAGRFLKPKKVATQKEMYRIKRGGMVVNSLEELSRVQTLRSHKIAAMQDIYGGKQDVFIQGDAPLGELIELPDQTDATRQDFTVSNIYMDVLVKEKPVIPGIDRDTGKEIFLIKKDSLLASEYVSREYLLHREAKEDGLGKLWDRPEHYLTVVAPVDWKEKYAEKVKEVKIEEEALTKAVNELLTGKQAADYSGDSKRVLILIPVDPERRSTKDYGYATCLAIFEGAKSAMKLSWQYGQGELLADVKSYKDGVLRTRYGEEYVVADRDTLMEKGIYVAAPDEVFKTKADADITYEGAKFVRQALSMDDASRATLWVKKESEQKFTIGIGHRDGTDMLLTRNLGTVGRKEASFLIGFAGGDPADILDRPWVGWRKFSAAGPCVKGLTKIAEAPAMLKQIVGDLAGQAKALSDSGGKVSINIENLNISIPDIAKGVLGLDEGAGEAAPQGTGGEELLAAGIPEETVQLILQMAGTVGMPAEEAVAAAMGYIEQGTSEGKGIDVIAQELAAMAEEQLAGVQSQGAPVEGAPVEGAPVEGAPSGQLPPLEQMVPMLQQLGITQQTIDMLLQLPAVLGVTPEEIIVQAGQHTEQAMQQGTPIEQINYELQTNAQQMMTGATPEIAGAAAMPDAGMTSQVPMDAQQEQMVADAGQQMTGAMPQTAPMPTQAYDQATMAAQNPAMYPYQNEMQVVRNGSLMADIIANATIKSKFLDYLPTLNNTINAVSELILKLELSRTQLTDEVGTSNLDKVSKDLRQVADLLGNLVLKIASFE